METEKDNKNQHSDSLFDKAKEIGKKAAELIENVAENVKETDFVKQTGDFFDKAEKIVEVKLEELEKKGVKEKMENVAEEVFDKAKIAGKTVVENVENLIDEINEKIKTKNNPPNDYTSPEAPL